MWNPEGFYALVLFFTIFIIITTCLMVICEHNQTGTAVTAQSCRCVFTVVAVRRCVLTGALASKKRPIPLIL